MVMPSVVYEPENDSFAVQVVMSMKPSHAHWLEVNGKEYPLSSIKHRIHWYKLSRSQYHAFIDFVTSAE